MIGAPLLIEALADAWDRLAAQTASERSGGLPDIGIRDLFATFEPRRRDFRGRPNFLVEDLTGQPRGYRFKSVSGEIEMTGLLREPFGIVLICFIKGGARLETMGRAMLVNAGDIVVLRTWQRARLDMADASDLIAIHMRLAFLHEDVEDDDRSGAALVSATDVVQPSFVFYNMIVRALTTFVKAHKGKPVDATHIDMLRGVLNLAFSASALTAKDGRGERAGRMAAITREVIVNIGDHKLSPTIVADKLGISTRTLFHEMEREGTSFTAIVASIRLDFAAYRLFRDTDRSGPRR